MKILVLIFGAWLPGPLLFTAYFAFYIKINGKKIKGCYATLLLLRSIRTHLQNKFFIYFYHLFFILILSTIVTSMALRVIFDPFMLRKRQKKVQFSKIRFLFCIVLFCCSILNTCGGV